MTEKELRTEFVALRPRFGAHGLARVHWELRVGDEVFAEGTARTRHAAEKAAEHAHRLVFRALHAAHVPVLMR